MLSLTTGNRTLPQFTFVLNPNLSPVTNQNRLFYDLWSPVMNKDTWLHTFFRVPSRLRIVHQGCLRPNAWYQRIRFGSQITRSCKYLCGSLCGIYIYTCIVYTQLYWLVMIVSHVIVIKLWIACTVISQLRNSKQRHLFYRFCSITWPHNVSYHMDHIVYCIVLIIIYSIFNAKVLLIMFYYFWLLVPCSHVIIQ